MIKASHLILLCAVLCSSIAFAANESPQKTDAFLSFCKTNNEGCINKVAEVSFVLLVPVPGAQPRKWCPTKESDDVKVLTPKVVQWLTAHPEVKGKKTEDGIKMALFQLYSCKAGNAAPKVLDSAEAFVTFCKAKANYDKCLSDLADVYFVFILNKKLAAANNFCEPKNFDVVDQAPPVLTWLEAHPDLGAMPKGKVIAKAWGAVYTCKKK